MKRKILQPWLTLAIALFLMFFSFLAGTKFGSHTFAREQLLASISGIASGAESIEDVSLQPIEVFQQVMSLLRQYYATGISPEQETELGYAAVRGLLAELKDPFTRFMDPEEFAGFSEESKGHFEGIGATLEMAQVEDIPEEDKKKDDTASPTPFKCKVCGADWESPVSYRVIRASAKGFEAEYVHDPVVYHHYRVTIVAPISGGPAERAGIKPGDQIVNIDGTSTYGMGLTEAVKRIKGPAGTPVKLIVSRKGEKKPLKITIIRSKIDIPTVESKLLQKGEIGYIKINSFNETSADLVAKELKELKSKAIKGLLLDLRNNPGGGLEPCLEIASMFISNGPIVYIQTRGNEPLPRMASKQSQDVDIPLVVLINRGSASGSEILAGAIKDRGVGKLVGERTFGKGLVQSVIRLEDQSAVAITTAKYLTPNKHEVNELGITPDKEVKQPQEPIEPLSEKDEQANVAIDILKKEIASRPVVESHVGNPEN